MYTWLDLRSSSGQDLRRLGFNCPMTTTDNFPKLRCAYLSCWAFFFFFVFFFIWSLIKFCKGHLDWYEDKPRPNFYTILASTVPLKWPPVSIIMCSECPNRLQIPVQQCFSCTVLNPDRFRGQGVSLRNHWGALRVSNKDVCAMQ